MAVPMRLSPFSLMIVIIIPSMLPGSCFILGWLLIVSQFQRPPSQAATCSQACKADQMCLSRFLMRKEGKWTGQILEQDKLPHFCVWPTHLHTKHNMICSVIPSVAFAQCPYVLVLFGTLGIQTRRRGKKMAASLLARAGLAKLAAESDSFVHSP